MTSGSGGADSVQAERGGGDKERHMSGKYDDAAVSRLVEAANAYRETVRPYEGVNDLARQAWWKFSQVIDAIPAPASAAPAKGVRCWRHMGYKGNPDPNSYDRIRRYGDGEYELVYRDGRTEKVHGTDYANSSAYVECPDSPYVAPPVAAPSSAGTEPAAMETAEAFVIRLNYTQGSADKAKMVESRDAAWQARNAAEVAEKDAKIERLTQHGHRLIITQNAVVDELKAAQVVWDGGPTGLGTNFHDAANWTGDVLPGAADDAVITGPGNVTFNSVVTWAGGTLSGSGTITPYPIMAKSLISGTYVADVWPWEAHEFKPSGNRIRDLVKAGALIAAEIDRLHRLENKHAH